MDTVLYDPIKNIKILFTYHAERRYRERLSHLEHDIFTEFKLATENKSIFNNTNFMLRILQKYGTESVQKFYTTKNTVFICKPKSANLLSCVTLYPTDNILFQNTNFHNKKKIQKEEEPEEELQSPYIRTTTTFKISVLTNQNIIKNLKTWPSQKYNNDIQELLKDPVFHSDIKNRIKQILTPIEQYAKVLFIRKAHKDVPHIIDLELENF